MRVSKDIFLSIFSFFFNRKETLLVHYLNIYCLLSRNLSVAFVLNSKSICLVLTNAHLFY